MNTRRYFLQSAAAAPLAAAAQITKSSPEKIRIATIGIGGMGTGDTQYALRLPNVELVAVADIYSGRLERVKERWGSQVFTTRDYREVLARKDVDAVIVATPDHWHSRISIAAMEAGKDVYCEKPMVHRIGEGMQMVEAQKRTGRILQIGSQYVSSKVFERARDLLNEGAIGELNMVEAWLDRNTALGAWQYSLPTDATPQTVDWDRFLGHAPKRPFEPVRLFRWRNYDDYGTGVAGDLFVHLLSGLHLVTGSIGPVRVYASGGVRFWKDGRDAADVMLALMDYPKTAAHPEFTFALRVNLASGTPAEKFGFRFVGSGGQMVTTMNGINLTRTPRETAPGYTIGTYSKKVQDEFLAAYKEKFPKGGEIKDAKEEFIPPPPGHEAHLDHHMNFHAAVRSRKPFVEDGVYGFRAAGPALLANLSLAEGRAIQWNPEKMVIA